MKTKKEPIKVFDVLLIPRLEKSWIHFDIEATDKEGKVYLHRSRGFGGFDPEHPAFPIGAVKNYFQGELHSYSYSLQSIDVNQILMRLRSYEWKPAIKSLRFSSQVYVCPETKIVWVDMESPKEGTSYYEIKELPDHDKIWICRDQCYDLRQWRDKQLYKRLDA